MKAFYFLILLVLAISFLLKFNFNSSKTANHQIEIKAKQSKSDNADELVNKYLKETQRELTKDTYQIHKQFDKADNSQINLQNKNEKKNSASTNYSQFYENQIWKDPDLEIERRKNIDQILQDQSHNSRSPSNSYDVLREPKEN